jgi:hypothetical protein
MIGARVLDARDLRSARDVRDGAARAAVFAYKNLGRGVF